MGAMHEFLRRLDEPAVRRSYEQLDETWNRRAQALNERLSAEDLPVRVANLVSVWTVCYTAPSRYNWMFQYSPACRRPVAQLGRDRPSDLQPRLHGRRHRGRLRSFLSAARAMREDGWWWHRPEMTDRALKKEMLRRCSPPVLGMRNVQVPHAASSDTMGSKSSPRST